MSPFFRGSVRPPRRHPRPWSMNPRLNPDIVMDGTSEKDHPSQTAEIGLPVTNSIYGRLADLTGGHTTDGGDPAATVAAAVLETNGGTITPTTTTTTDGDVSKSTGPTFDPGDEAVTETTQPGQSLARNVTRDSGTAMIESPYLNDFVEKGSQGPSSPEETLGVPSDAGHARADSSTMGAAGTVGIVGPVPDTQAVETDEEEKGEDVDSGDPMTDVQTVSDGAPALGEPLMDDAQLDVSDEFRPGTAVRGGEPREPLISDEQLEVSDEFRPQTNMQGPV